MHLVETPPHPIDRVQRRVVEMAFAGSLAVAAYLGIYVATADTSLPEQGTMAETTPQPPSSPELAIAGITGLTSLAAAGIFGRMLGERPPDPS